MNKEETQMMAFQLIGFAGDAFSHFFQAIDAAKKADYEEAERLFKSSKATRELCELRNMINVGYLITKQAMERKESRGLHYTIDYPHKKD